MAERSANLSYEEVASAIESLLAQNKKPTCRRVHKFLCRGSLTTISNFSKDYFQSSQYKLQMNSSQLSEQFLGATIAEFKRIMDKMTMKNILQLETAHEDVDDLSRDLSNALEEVRDYKGQIETLNERIKRLESENAMSQTKAETELNSKNVRVETLETELNNIRNELAEAKRSLIINEHQMENVNNIKTRLDDAEKTNSNFLAEFQELNRELLKATREKAELEKKLLEYEGNTKSKPTTK